VSQDQKSRWANILTGVPQGSVLGPLLFLIYLFDLPKVLQYCTYVMYADDIQLYIHFPLNDYENCLNKMICDLINTIVYCEQHNLILNVSKTQAIILGTQRFLTMLDSMSPPPLIVNECVIPFSDSVKNLGVVIDKTLSWTEQCIMLVQKVFSTLAQLRRTVSFIPTNIRKMLVSSLIMPHLDYCSVLLTDISDGNNLKLQRLQNSCVRFITGASRYEHITPYYKELGMLKLQERRTVAIAVMIFKIMVTKTPAYLFDKFKFTSSNNLCLTRSSKMKLIIPNHRTEKFHLSFLIQSSKIWNDLELYNFVHIPPYAIKNTIEKIIRAAV
jgi:hypothetical protein